MLENLSLESKAISILEVYVGGNNYILELKKKFLLNKKFYPTRSQSEYIINNHDKSPKVAKKWVTLDAYFAQKMADDKLYTEVPQKLWIEKLLSESDKAYHVWGRVFENEQLHHFWLPKVSVIKDNTVKDVVISYEKYANRPPLSHQKEAIQKLVENKKFILADDMGLGKTTSTILAALESGAKKVLIICPATLKINWKREIENYSDRSIYISEGKNFSCDHDFVIINYDIIKNFHETKKKGKSIIKDCNFDLVVLDECFTYDTKIITEIGEKNIGDIVENGLNVKILTYNHENKVFEYKKINRWIRKNKDTIYKIKLNNGLFIECTDNHKFYVNNKGYVRANELTTTDDLYMLSETINKETDLEKNKMLLKKLRLNSKKQNLPSKTERIQISKKLCEMWKFDGIYNRKENDVKNILFGNLFKHGKSKQFRSERKKKRNNRKKWRMVKNNEKHTQEKPSYGKIIFPTNEKKQPDEKFEEFRKNERKIKRENIFSKGREWKNNTTTRNVISDVRGRMDNGTTNINQKCQQDIQKLTPLLQSGYRKLRIKNINRDRWKITQNQKMELFGFEKNKNIKFIRVESIEILERGSYDKSTNLHSKNTRVYDLEIEDNHNYFANSILVSNCHYVKNAQAQRTKLINDLVKNVDRLWLLTGTPMTSRPMDYFNLLSLVDSPVSKNWMAYAIRYCAGYQFSVGGRKVWNVTGASNLEELRDRTSGTILRRLKENVLDLPDKIITPVYLKLRSKEYEDVMGDYYNWYEKNPEESRSLTVQFTKLTKVRQIIANEKILQTIELAENIIEQGKKVIIFCNFTEPVDKIMQHFAKAAVRLDGSMSKPERQHSVDQFQENDKVKVFVGNIKAAGVGITLTAGEAVIMNDLSFLPSDHSQAEDRAYRYGQKNNVLVYYPLYENTIETVIYDILKKKKEVIATVMGDNITETDYVEQILQTINKMRK
jgi:intein/homing endonuclease